MRGRTARKREPIKEVFKDFKGGMSQSTLCMQFASVMCACALGGGGPKTDGVALCRKFVSDQRIMRGFTVSARARRQFSSLPLWST